jgi:hypothetical protein
MPIAGPCVRDVAEGSEASGGPLVCHVCVSRAGPLDDPQRSPGVLDFRGMLLDWRDAADSVAAVFPRLTVGSGGV